VLAGLFQNALQDSEQRRLHTSESDLLERIETLTKVNDVYSHLAPASHIKLIAEIKRRSPSKGFLAGIPSAAELAKIYQSSGAHAISVLTESSGFGGSLEDLSNARSAVEIPLLRKDFISTEYQILEARAAGADFVLLILAHLDQSEFASLYEFAHSLGLGVLVETHTTKEIERAKDLGAQLIGINTRNLETFETDLALYEEMAGLLPASSIKVAESSVKNLADVQRYRDAGADVVLVGEALVTGDPETLIPQFTSVA